MYHCAKYIALASLAALLNGCAMSSRDSFNWDSLDYASIGCPPGNQSPGCKNGDDSIASVSRSKK